MRKIYLLFVCNAFVFKVQATDHLLLSNPRKAITPKPLTERQSHRWTEQDTTKHRVSVFTLVERMPEFHGGAAAMFKFIDTHLSYPTNLPKLKEKVFTTFIVNTDGSIANANIDRSLRQDYDEAALRLINSMPKWIPGRQSRRNVRVRYSLPIEFK